MASGAGRVCQRVTVRGFVRRRSSPARTEATRQVQVRLVGCSHTGLGSVVGGTPGSGDGLHHGKCGADRACCGDRVLACRWLGPSMGQAQQDAGDEGAEGPQA